MNNIEIYYENTKGAQPHKLLEEFLKYNVKPTFAIDLGCGAGRDTIYLIKQGWKVLGIDKENTEEIISDELDEDEKNRFQFCLQKFEEITIEKNNLIVANFSLSFCNKNCFSDLWDKIQMSINQNGYFVGNFFGNEDAWAKIKTEMTFLKKEEVLKLFKKNFDILEFDEINEDSTTAIGKKKHWHYFNVIAKRNKGYFSF